MSILDLQQALEHAKGWAREAGALQLEYLNKKIKFHTKSSEGDMVTEVDFLCEKLILGGIMEHYPEHGIISEEAGKSREGKDYIWVVDPLDGTNNYFHGYPMFGVSIALRKNDETVMGVVYMPKLDEMYYSVKGMGAYLNDIKLEVSEIDNLQKALLATGFPYDKAEDLENNNLDIVKHIVPGIMGIRRSGCAAFDMCCVASGVLDGYWELKVKLWDLAAGELIVREAGGKVLLSFREKGLNVIAGNKKMVDLVQSKIDECYKNFIA